MSIMLGGSVGIIAVMGINMHLQIVYDVFIVGFIVVWIIFATLFATDWRKKNDDVNISVISKIIYSIELIIAFSLDFSLLITANFIPNLSTIIMIAIGVVGIVQILTLIAYEIKYEHDIIKKTTQIE